MYMQVGITVADYSPHKILLGSNALLRPMIIAGVIVECDALQKWIFKPEIRIFRLVGLGSAATQQADGG